MQRFEERGRVPANLAVAVADPVQVVEVFRLGELLRLGHAPRERLPRDDRLDGLEGIAAGLLGFEQGVADPVEQAHLLVDRLARLLELLFVMAPGAVEQRADDAVVEIDDLIDHGRPGFEHHGNQRGVASRGLEFAHVLGGHLTAFACQLQEPVLVDLAFDAGRERRALPSP